ncbi:MAG: hypothetical protein ACRCY4_00980 [Brevinema sp.]
MKILLVAACIPESIDAIFKKISVFADTDTLYSLFYSCLPADFPLGLRFDTIDLVPWDRYDGIVVCGGSRITSLVTECSYNAGIPVIIIYPPTQSVWVQSPIGGIIDIPQGLYPASIASISSKQLDSIDPLLFDKATHSVMGEEIKLRDKQYFRTGQFCDLVSVACSEDTSSVTASDITIPDTRSLAETIQSGGIAHLQRVSNLFAEFQWNNKRMMIYRQGRLSLSPCEDAEEVFFAYQFFINS